MSWFDSSVSGTDLDDIHTYNMDEGWRMIPDEPSGSDFVDVALHVGNFSVIRIILPSGGLFSIKDATAIRDALTRAIDRAESENTK